LNGEYESIAFIAFIDTNDECKITRLVFEEDSRYHFNLDKPPRNKSIFDGVKLPESVLEPIINRARYHGMIDRDIEDTDITDNFEEYRAYKTNAELMLDNIIVGEHDEWKK
jgi:hypothetical protein